MPVIDYMELFTVFISSLKEIVVKAFPILAPYFLIGILIGFIVLMAKQILSTKIGATIALTCIAVFLVKQGVI